MPKRDEPPPRSRCFRVLKFEAVKLEKTALLRVRLGKVFVAQHSVGLTLSMLHSFDATFHVQGMDMTC